MLPLNLFDTMPVSKIWREVTLACRVRRCKETPLTSTICTAKVRACEGARGV